MPGGPGLRLPRSWVNSEQLNIPGPFLVARRPHRPLFGRKIIFNSWALWGFGAVRKAFYLLPSHSLIIIIRNLYLSDAEHTEPRFWGEIDPRGMLAV